MDRLESNIILKSAAYFVLVICSYNTLKKNDESAPYILQSYISICPIKATPGSVGSYTSYTSNTFWIRMEVYMDNFGGSRQAKKQY